MPDLDRLARECAAEMLDHLGLSGGSDDGTCSTCVHVVLTALRSAAAGELREAAGICDELHDVPMHKNPDEEYQVGVNVGGLKRCEELASRLRARAEEVENG